MLPKRSTYLLLFYFISNILHAQYTVKSADGYSPQIGIMVYMLEDMKDRVKAEVADLSQEETDFLFDEHANSIGALVMHLVSNEAYYLSESIEERPWDAEEMKLYGNAGSLGKKTRNTIKGKPITYYLNLWDEVRSRTLAGLKEKDDEWLASNIEDGINHHWVWYHVMEHSANHLGQISLIKNRLKN